VCDALAIGGAGSLDLVVAGQRFRWEPNGAHIRGTLVPVDEPSTASIRDSCIATIF